MVNNKRSANSHIWLTTSVALITHKTHVSNIRNKLKKYIASKIGATLDGKNLLPERANSKKSPEFGSDTGAFSRIQHGPQGLTCH